MIKKDIILPKITSSKRKPFTKTHGINEFVALVFSYFFYSGIVKCSEESFTLIFYLLGNWVGFYVVELRAQYHFGFEFRTFLLVDRLLHQSKNINSPITRVKEVFVFFKGGEVKCSLSKDFKTGSSSSYLYYDCCYATCAFSFRNSLDL